MYHFCTYFDRHYLYKGLALYRSLARHSSSFVLWVLCFDDVTYDILKQLNWPGMHLISQREFEQDDHELMQARQDRSLVEYYWTCTPSLPYYILRQNPEIDVLTYLDADLYFYQDPQPLYTELADSSILIVKHRYSPEHAVAASRRGIFNVSVLSFRNDSAGLSCLRWWRDRCLEWCFNRVEEGKFADQKYLDDWPSRFSKVCVVKNKGISLAPWNISNYNVCLRNGRIYVDDDELIVYHFHSLRIITASLYELAAPGYKITREQVRLIYRPYLRELQLAMREVQRVDPDFDFGYTRLRWYSKVGGLLLGRLVYHRAIL